MDIKYLDVHAHTGGLYSMTAVVGGDIKTLSQAKIKPEEYELTIKKKTHKRSLDANSLYWSALSKLAKAVKTSMPQMHNTMLCRYGQPMFVDERLVYVFLPDTEEAEQKVENDETVHLKATSQTRNGKDGKIYRAYILLRGSSSYNTKEFSDLLDGLISECNSAGVDILSEKDREQIRRYEQWKNGEK